MNQLKADAQKKWTKNAQADAQSCNSILQKKCWCYSLFVWGHFQILSNRIMLQSVPVVFVRSIFLLQQ